MKTHTFFNEAEDAVNNITRAAVGALQPAPVIRVEQNQRREPFKAASRVKVDGISRRGVLKGKEPNPLRVRRHRSCLLAHHSS